MLSANPNFVTTNPIWIPFSTRTMQHVFHHFLIQLGTIMVQFCSDKFIQVFGIHNISCRFCRRNLIANVRGVNRASETRHTKYMPETRHTKYMPVFVVGLSETQPQSPTTNTLEVHTSKSIWLKCWILTLPTIRKEVMLPLRLPSFLMARSIFYSPLCCLSWSFKWFLLRFFLAVLQFTIWSHSLS